MAIHKNQRVNNGLHVAHAFEFANEAARWAFVPSAGDQYKLGLQLDTMALYILTSESPATWAAIVPGDVPPHNHDGAYAPVHTHPYQATSEKNLANGYAGLDNGAKINEAQLPDSILGQVEYKGIWNAATNTPTLPAASSAKGEYYVTSTAGTYNSMSFNVGDWVISNGTDWQKVNNTDAVPTVFGRTGNIVAAAGDYAGIYSAEGHTHPYAASTHTHAGSDITSIVANADMLDGQHASEFAAYSHTHPYANSTHSHAGSDITSQVGDAHTVDGKHASDFIQTSGGTLVGSMTLANNEGLFARSTSGFAHTLAFMGADNGVHLGTDNAGLIVHSYGNPVAVVAGQVKQLWHEGNDGSGSGLDADTIDGYHAASLLTKTDGGDINARIRVGIDGRGVDYFQSNLELNTSDGTPPGISFHRGGVSACNLYEQSGALRLKSWVGPDSPVWTGNNHGAGSGLDADLLDGHQASEFAPSTHTHFSDLRSTDASFSGYSITNQLELKGNGIDGLNDGGLFHRIVSLKAWNDISGGQMNQIALTDNGNMYLRTSINDSWGSWTLIGGTAGASMAQKIRTSAPVSPVSGDIWIG